MNASLVNVATSEGEYVLRISNPPLPGFTVLFLAIILDVRAGEPLSLTAVSVSPPVSAGTFLSSNGGRLFHSLLAVYYECYIGPN